MRSGRKDRAPDYAEPITGVRGWRVDKSGVLSSITKRNEQWMPREVKRATCDRVQAIVRHTFAGSSDLPDPRRKVVKHEAPQSGCSCGLYAFYDRRSLKEHGDGFSAEDGHVTGVVSAWGERVILCEYGFKAQYMKLEALVLEQETVTVFGFPISAREAYEKLARRYGVPLLSPTQVAAFSKEQGAAFETQSADAKFRSPYGPPASALKPVALLETILEWRKESEDQSSGHRTGSQGGAGGAPAPPQEGGADDPT